MRSRLDRRPARAGLALDPPTVLTSAIVALLLMAAVVILARDARPEVGLAAEDGRPRDLAAEEGTGASDRRGIEALVPDVTGDPAGVETTPEGDAAEAGTVTSEPGSAPAAPQASEGRPDETTSADPAPPADGDAVAAGDCFDGPSRPLPEITVIDCASSHDNEVYLVVQVPGEPGAPFPGEEALRERAAELCRGQAFTDYVGVAWADSRFFTAPAVPSEETWAAGDRRIACVLYDLRGPRTGSAQDSQT